MVDARLGAFVADRVQSGCDLAAWSSLAAAFHARLADLLLEVLRQVRATVGRSDLCLGGSLFQQSWFNTVVRQSAVFKSGVCAGRSRQRRPGGRCRPLRDG